MARITITEVARRAGVSIASASRALNGTGAAPATTDKVQRAADELGYVPDATARSLKLRRTQQLAYAVADIGNPIYVEMMGTIESEVAAAGYRLVVSRTGDADSTLDLVRSLSRGYVDGLVISPLRVTPALIAALQQAPVPVVVVGRLPEDAGIDTVMVDSAGGIVSAIDHLQDTGRQRLVLVNGPTDTTPGAVRHAAFTQAVPAGHVVTGEDFTVAAGYRCGQELFAAGSRFDAVVAANDLLAIGVLHAAADAGVDVPGEVAVVGMDDTSLARLFRPTLTSVSLAADARGRSAAELLLARLVEPEREPTTVLVPTQLRIRASTDTARPQG
ncbi:MAG: LacI family DNA-binding transcriptional regulator [Beutenbergiaceae bacterium]